ncbi:MAG TPA: hypothetical protein VN843_23250, partial [Anaerolineales bacterium]|nr:hypothetical protein [Anaerolineales bacterium]
PTPTDKPIALPSPYAGTLELVASEKLSSICDKAKSPFVLPADGVLQLSFLPNRKCDDVNSDLDLFEVGDRLHVAQRNARGFRLVDVTNPLQPTEIGVWELEPHTTQEHITTFHQFDRRYLAMPLESPTPYGNFPCGLAIIEVTQPEAPVLRGRYDGSILNSDVSWCNVHATEVDTDENGNATFLFLATLNTADLRVLDIRNLEDIHEVNVFHQHIHPHGEYGSWAHRAAIQGNRVYISYWGGGVIIVDKHGLENGLPPEEVMLTSIGSIDPNEFVTHDSQPTSDGNFLFVNEMDGIANGIRLFDIRDLSHPREIWASTMDTETGQHTLQISDNLLFVPWFRKGLRVFRFDVSDPEQPVIEQVAFQAVRKPLYAGSDGGVGALRVHSCQVEGAAKTCIYASDEEMGLIILALDDN